MVVANDTWMRDPSTGLVLQMREHAGDDMRLLEGVVSVAEVDTVRHPQSALVHYFLSLLYVELPKELSRDFKEMVEREKLRAEGKKYILDMPRDIQDILRSIGPNPTDRQRFGVARDYVHRAGLQMYMNKDNAQRAVSNLDDGIRKGQGNYLDIRNSTCVSLLLDERIRPHMATTAILFSHL